MPTLHLLSRRLLSLCLALSLAACSGPASYSLGTRSEGTAPAMIARLGLGTEAGNQRWSVITRDAFYRRSATPDALFSCHYNDAEGARSMAERLGGGRKHSGGFLAADKRLRVTFEGTDWPRRTLEHYQAGDQTIVIGQHGSTYAIELENRTSKRLEVLASVDGLSVMNGQPASFSQRGYAIEPHSRVTIKGFRLNDRQIREFRFGSVASSQAAKSGSPKNVGVIGLAVFEENQAQRQQALQAEQNQRQQANAFPGAD